MRWRSRAHCRPSCAFGSRRSRRRPPRRSAPGATPKRTTARRSRPRRVKASGRASICSRRTPTSCCAASGRRMRLRCSRMRRPPIRSALRIAFAEKQLGRADAARVDSLSYRLQLALDGLDTTHAREAAYFALYVLDRPELALERALANWNVQREPIDARLVLESALAAHRAADARPVARLARVERLRARRSPVRLERRLRIMRLILGASASARDVDGARARSVALAADPSGRARRSSWPARRVAARSRGCDRARRERRLCDHVARGRAAPRGSRALRAAARRDRRRRCDLSARRDLGSVDRTAARLTRCST